MFIPVNVDKHWSLAVLGNLSALLSSAKAAVTTEEQVKPTMLYLDSLHHSGLAVAGDLERFLRVRFELECHTACPVPQGTPLLRVMHPKVPFQDNFSDCGVCTLEQSFLS